MKRYSSLFILVAVLLSLLTGAMGQGRGPLSLKDIEGLVGRVTSPRMVTLIERHGVDFELTAEVRERLRSAGADAAVLTAVEQAAVAYTRKTMEEERRKIEEEKKKIEAAKQREAEQRKAEEERRKAAEAQRTGEMVSVPAGEFFMGCNERVDTECDDDEKPGRRVRVDAFKIDKTEVTVAQYARCVDAGSCSSDGLTMPYWNDKEQPEWAWACNWGKAGRENHPINCITWRQAQEYCAWTGKRLPTETEWEKAARGTDGRKYAWGNRGYGAAGLVANIADEAAKRQYPDWTVANGYNDGFVGTAPVGSFPAGASPYGALDMIGNVWEWTADWYDAERKFRADRGGSWSVSPRDARASYRGWIAPGGRSGGLGVRCAQ